jgi:predicted nucleic acid-binding protein
VGREDVRRFRERLSSSVISVFEVRAGMRPKEEEATERLLSLLEKYEVNEAIARRAAEDYRRFAPQGIML